MTHKTPVYNAQVFTFAIAREMTGDYREVTHGDVSFAPPFCLRLTKPCRTREVQQFRDAVAKETRQRRGHI
jgi:hypothetical protein